MRINSKSIFVFFLKPKNNFLLCWLHWLHFFPTNVTFWSHLFEKVPRNGGRSLREWDICNHKCSNNNHNLMNLHINENQIVVHTFYYDCFRNMTMIYGKWSVTVIRRSVTTKHLWHTRYTHIKTLSPFISSIWSRRNHKDFCSFVLLTSSALRWRDDAFDLTTKFILRISTTKSMIFKCFSHETSLWLMSYNDV